MASQIRSPKSRRTSFRHPVTTKNHAPRWLSLLALSLAVAVLTRPAAAATDTWTDNGGSGDDNWATGTNWSDGANAAPSPYDSLLFTGANGLTNNNNFTAGTAFDGITFNSGASAFTLGGNGVLLSGQVNNPTDAISPGIVNSSANNQTISLPITLDWGTYQIGNTTTGALAINSTLTANTGGIVEFGGAGAGAVTSTSLTTDASGLISGLGGIGLIENTTTSNALAVLPLATLSGTSIVSLPSGSYVTMTTGAEISAVANADSNVLLNPGATGVTYTANDTGNAGVTLVNTVVQESGTETIVITGTMVVGAGSANAAGGFYETEPTAAANAVMLISGSTVADANPSGWLTSGTTSSGGTIVFGINSTPGNASNEINENAPIINNPQGGAVTVIKTGPGSMNFHLVGTNDSNYSGGTYVEQGLLQANATSVLGVGPIYVAGGATLYLESSQSNNLFLSPGVGDSSSFGALKLSQASSVQSGTITLLGAPVTATPGDRISDALTSGVYEFTNQVTGAGTLDLQTQETNAATAFELDNTTANANNWTGGTIIESNGGSDRLVVQDMASNQFGASGGSSAGNMTFTAASANTGSLTFNLNGFSDTVGALITNGAANTSGVYVNNSAATAATLTIGDNNASGSFAGVIENSSSALSIVKIGGGTQTLSGISTFTGSLAVNAGILNLTGSLNNTSGVTVSDATLEGNGFIGNATNGVTIGNGLGAPGSALLEPGSATSLGKLNTTSAVSLLSDAEFVFNFNSTGGGAGSGSSELLAASVSLNADSEFSLDDIAVTPGDLTQGTVFTAILTSPGDLTGSFENLPQGDVLTVGPNQLQANYTADSLTFTVVPEPATWGSLLLGFGLLMGIQRLRKRPLGT